MSSHPGIVAAIGDDAVIRNESLVQRRDGFPSGNDPEYSVKEGIAALSAALHRSMLQMRTGKDPLALPNLKKGV